MDPPGVEPGSPPRQGDVVPLDYGPFRVSAWIQWTAGESNPDLRRAMPVSSRWTSSSFERMNWPGNRTLIPGVKARSLYGSGVARTFTRRSARESNSVSLPTEEVCCRNTCRPANWESSRQDSNLRSPVCKTGVFAARRRDESRSVARVGFEPTGTRPSTWPRCQLAYRAVKTDSCGSGSRTSVSERMKLGRAPAHPRVPGPGIDPGTPGL